jgi:hypothetical protein
MPDRDRVGGNCEACKILFETEAFSSKIDEFLEEKMVELEGELILLESLSLLNAEDVGLLWRNTALTRAAAPL